MRKMLLIMIVICISKVSFSALPKANSLEMPPMHSSQVDIYLKGTKQPINLHKLASIKRKEFESLTGNKMNFFERLGFKVLQRKLNRSIDKNGYLTDKNVKRLFKQNSEDSSFHTGGFLLGFFGSWIGLIVAHLIRDENRPGRKKWAWIGFGLSFVVVALIIFTGIFIL